MSSLLDKVNKAIEVCVELEENDEAKYYGIRLPLKDLKLWKKKLFYADKYNINIKNFVAYGWEDDLKLECGRTDFIFTKKPHCTNPTFKYIFDENEYIRLDNGNVGRLMFCDMVNYDNTNELWIDFENELLSYNPVEYDRHNFNFIYKIEDGIRLYKNYFEIFMRYKKLFDEVIKQEEIKKLEAKLLELKK